VLVKVEAKYRNDTVVEVVYARDYIQAVKKALKRAGALKKSQGIWMERVGRHEWIVYPIKGDKIGEGYRVCVKPKKRR